MAWCLSQITKAGVYGEVKGTRLLGVLTRVFPAVIRDMAYFSQFSRPISHGLPAVGQGLFRCSQFCILPSPPSQEHVNQCAYIHSRARSICLDTRGRVNYKYSSKNCDATKMTFTSFVEATRFGGILPKQMTVFHQFSPVSKSMRLFSTRADDARTTSTSNSDVRETDQKSGTRDSLEHFLGNVSEMQSSISNSPSPSEVDFLDLDQALSLEENPDDEIDILEERDVPVILHEYANLPLLPESYSLASYVDHSETLQKLVQMGVDLSKLEQRKGVASMLLQMDFERDIKDRLAFLHHTGVPGEKRGAFITRNPFILAEELQTLEARVHFLLEKGFTEAGVAQIVNRAPFFLSFSIERLDNKLGYYQQLFGFSDSQVRDVITRCPKLVTMKVARPKENLFVLEFQCGFSKAALRSMVIQEPALLLRGKFQLIMIFDYLHNTMKIPHKLLLKMPAVFLGRVDRVKDRHKFLRSLRRNQYDPKEPGYVSLMDLFKLPDDAFCQKVAKTSVEDYELFLKTCRV